MVTYCVTKIIPTCSPVIGQCFDTLIVASIDKELVIMTHQNLNLGMCWKLFWATLTRLFSVTVSHNRWKDTPAVWRSAISSQVPSSLSTGYQHCSQDLAETNPSCKRMSAKEQARYFSSCINHFTASSLPIRNVHIIVKRSSWCPLNFFGSKVCSHDRDVSKQRARNVPLASADVRGGGRLSDDLKEYLRMGGYARLLLQI